MKDKELVSNCCGARVDSLNADNIGICSECKEGCLAVEERVPDRLRGVGLNWLWMDEASFQNREVWEVIYPALTDKGGYAWITTTPREKKGNVPYFREEWEVENE